MLHWISSAWWKKPTRRFFAGKADTSIFRWESRHVDFWLKKRTRQAWKFFSIKKDQFDKCIIEETISENTYK